MLIAMSGCLTSFASSSLLIHLKDSTVIICPLAKQPQMVFGEKTITLSSLEGTVGQWNFADVESWNFADVEDVEAIDEVTLKPNRIKIEEGKIMIAGNNAKRVSVYDLSGRAITPSITCVGNTASISLTGFTKGTYLLKVGNSSIKFIVE